MGKMAMIAIGLLVASAAWADAAPPPAPAATIPAVLKQKVVPFAPASGSGWTVGCVLLQYDVSGTGVPENIRILDSAPEHVLDRLAVSTLARWRYQPATQRGRSVVTRNLKQMLTFHSPASDQPPPYRLCGGNGNLQPGSLPTGLPSRVNLDITRAAVVQTFSQAAQSSGFTPRKGRVSVRFCVNSRGHTENLSVVQSSPPDVFDPMALALMRAAVFKPHEIHGVAVTACGITQPIVFEMSRQAH